MAGASAYLRETALALFRVAVKAADPGLALRRAVADAPFPLPEGGGKLILVAVGKAAMPMMQAALTLVPNGVITNALAVTNYENTKEIPGVQVMAAGHPVPDENGEKAAQAVIALLTGAGPQDRVVALISGGGSALLPAPAPGLTLADKAAVNQILLAAGFGITEMNLIRQQISALKGGGFLRQAAPAPVVGYILSDVIGDDLRVIASGLTVGPIGTSAEAMALLKGRGVWDQVPQPVQAHLMAAGQAEPMPAVQNHLIGSNRQSLKAVQAAAKAWQAAIVSDRLVGDVADAAQTILAAARAMPATAPRCLIFGGETTVTLRGKGRGGRNQELALRLAMGADLPGEWVFLSGGTDGRDGPTDAAGGLVDAGSVGRMQAAGIDPVARLDQNDSYTALEASGDLIMIGGTGTNVADVQILLLHPKR